MSDSTQFDHDDDPPLRPTAPRTLAEAEAEIARLRRRFHLAAELLRELGEPHRADAGSDEVHP